MIKNVMKRVWAFDIEWVPDPDAGRVLYELAEDVGAQPREHSRRSARHALGGRAVAKWILAKEIEGGGRSSVSEPPERSRRSLEAR